MKKIIEQVNMMDADEYQELLRQLSKISQEAFEYSGSDDEAHNQCSQLLKLAAQSLNFRKGN